ncbi:alanine dehydrogenase [Alkalitalea saponilacus]|uniref:alanine dehydrogenase n=1 Tax=Alkalitalea saponilacus TaxID=889453 RepID=A0A1T5FSD3_9BACT|nr:alanine dehydrogenase [Alkalitalea saponilacus]ASB49481.1 alanine dehydrogenase [Alkalitalea saponilacus]SKB99079.1 alanine dehydrogenase [Alkalitalea saponilacus]
MTKIEKRVSYFAIRQTQMIPREEMLETGRQQRSISIGIPKETDPSENRVSLTPQGVELLCENGHKVTMESGAGDAANYFDKDFSEAGATIVKSKEEVFKSEIILKIAPPSSEEINLMHPYQLLLSFLYMPHQSRDTIRQLMDRRINAIAYEFLKDESGCYPVIRSMSEIEGYAAITIASEYLSKAHGGKGVLLGGITGISPTEVVIIGAGTAGEFAARAALGLGCQVKVFDNSYQNLKELERNVGQRLFTSILHPKVLTKALKSADAVVASLRCFDCDHGFFITREQVNKMKKGSVIVDLSVGNGGCFETSQASNSPGHPFVDERGVIHYFVPNIASRVARTASIALSNIFAPILLRLAESGGVHQLIKSDTGVSSGTYIYKGILTNSHIGNQLGIPFKDIGLLLAAF